MTMSYSFQFLAPDMKREIFEAFLEAFKDYAIDISQYTQDIFIKLYTKIAEFEERAQLSTWIYRVTYNYCIDLLRKRKKEEKLFSPEAEISDDIEEDIDDQEILEIEVKKLKIVLDMIPEGDKAVLMMKYQDDMSIKEIAQILNKTESSIKMKLKRAKHKTQKVYKETFKDLHI